MKKPLLVQLILSFFLTATISNAQKQGNRWFFGDHAGLDFNSGSPVFDGNGQTYFISGHNEGTSSICDSAGNLLMYTNGEKIWDRNHQVMPNGDTLMGGASSTQAALIIPKPGSSRFFYVFTTDDFFQGNLLRGLRYSVVDLCLNNGNGDVITGQKNILLHTPVAEKLTAVRHANGLDYWVITHEFFSDAFYSYRLTSAGIIDSVISHVGSVHPTGQQNVAAAIGQMKASPDGNKLALVNGNSNNSIAEYFDFNKSNGVVSNMVNIQTNLLYNYYGVSFSPDNTKLYITCILNGNGVYQFDLTAGGGHPDSVRASKTNVSIGYNYNFRALQLGVDGKIYVTRSPNANPYLSVITNPNNPGLSCLYLDNFISLNGHEPSYGLPNFIDSYDYSNTINGCAVQSIFSGPHYLCPGTCTSFLNLSQNATSYQWYFPGASPSSSTDEHPTTICYNTAGTYDVTLIAMNGMTADTVTLANYITVYPQPAPQSIIQNDDTLFALQGATSYQWYYNGNAISGATDYFYVAPLSGNYNVVATNANGCEVEAAILNVIATTQSPVSVSSGSEQLEVFPNPVSETLYVKGYSLIGTADIVSIYDLMGEKIHSGIYTESIDCRNISSGVYILEVSSNGKIFRTPFVKQ